MFTPGYTDPRHSHWVFQVLGLPDKPDSEGSFWMHTLCSCGQQQMRRLHIINKPGG